MNELGASLGHAVPVYNVFVKPVLQVKCCKRVHPLALGIPSKRFIFGLIGPLLLPEIGPGLPQYPVQFGRVPTA